MSGTLYTGVRQRGLRIYPKCVQGETQSCPSSRSNHYASGGATTSHRLRIEAKKNNKLWSVVNVKRNCSPIDMEGVTPGRRNMSCTSSQIMTVEDFLGQQKYRNSPAEVSAGLQPGSGRYILPLGLGPCLWRLEVSFQA